MPVRHCDAEIRLLPLGGMFNCYTVLPSLTMPRKTSIPSKTRGKHPRLPSLRAEQENSPSPPPEHPTKRTWNQSASARQAEEEQYEREVRAAKRKADKADDMSIVAFKT